MRQPIVDTLAELPPDELEFQDKLKLHLGAHAAIRWWRQNSGVVAIRNSSGKIERWFHAGPPKGACDLSGIVRPEGFRLEVELKSAKGKRHKEQIAFGEMIERFGGVYVLVQYDPTLSLKENLAQAERIIFAAIERRRAA